MYFIDKTTIIVLYYSHKLNSQRIKVANTKNALMYIKNWNPVRFKNYKLRSLKAIKGNY